MAQKPLVKEVIESRGHKVIFYPKFHCELNFIEMFWGAAKRYARNNCDYSFRALEKIVPEVFLWNKLDDMLVILGGLWMLTEKV